MVSSAAKDIEMSYLGQMGRGVESAHVAHLGVAVGAMVVIGGFRWDSNVQLSLT